MKRLLCVMAVILAFAAPVAMYADEEAGAQPPAAAQAVIPAELVGVWTGKTISGAFSFELTADGKLYFWYGNSGRDDNHYSTATVSGNTVTVSGGGGGGSCAYKLSKKGVLTFSRFKGGPGFMMGVSYRKNA